MTRILLAAVLAPSLFASARVSASAETFDEPRQMTVRSYNYAEVSDSVMRVAKRESDRIFTQLGIETHWLNCPTSAELIASNRACSVKPGPDHLILKLLPKSMSKKYGFKRGIFGFALPTAKGIPGNSISLFIERVLDLAFYGGVGTSFLDAQAIILGHMIVHEVGHLLLGPESHSARGVMSFPWDERVLTNMERGRLQFSAKERSVIHKELDRRAGLLQAAKKQVQTGPKISSD